MGALIETVKEESAVRIRKLGIGFSSSGRLWQKAKETSWPDEFSGGVT
jgi:hypothetical protein